MFRLIWIASVHIRYFLRRYMPSNVVLDLLRSRRGLKYGLPAMLLAVPYLFVADLLTGLIEGGGPGWLHVLVAVCVWDSMKFVFMGPVSVMLLAGARAREWRARRASRRALRGLV